MNKASTTLVLSLALTISAFSQTEHHSSEAKHIPHFRMASFIGHTLIPANHNESHLFIPSWGVDIEYWPTPHWGIGFHNDIELESFIVQRQGEELIERNYPILSTLDVLYKPGEHLVLMGGAGYEFEENNDFFLLRLGLEYEIELHHHWDIFPTLFYDTATGERNYNTWTLGLGIGKRF